MTTIILEKLQSYLDINEEQKGIRPDRFTTDAIFTVRQIVEKAVEYKVPAFMCFVYLKKVFEQVRRSDYIDILEEIEITTQLETLVRDIYTNGGKKNSNWKSNHRRDARKSGYTLRGFA